MVDSNFAMIRVSRFNAPGGVSVQETRFENRTRRFPFLVSAFLKKRPDYYSHSFFSFLRLRASEAKRRSLYCSAFTSVLVFFSRDIPSAFVLIEGYFLRAYFSATIQTFQKETQLDALSNRVKTFRKFPTGAILLASKARNFRKFLGFLSILLFFFSQTTANWPDVGTNRRKTMFCLIW